MTRWDACNGDADGLCALHQWRLSHPAPDARLVTGLKRDIALLERVPAGDGDEVTVFDVSIGRNRVPLQAMLVRGARVRWFDHHEAGELPAAERLAATIDTSAQVCTSILVDRAVEGAYRRWAIVGAFGDGLVAQAIELAATLPLVAPQVAALRELGEAINYNAYGDTEEDVLVPPAQLYASMRDHEEPFAMLRAESVFRGLATEQRADLERAFAEGPARSAPDVEIWRLPDSAWARRVSGTLANRLAARRPSGAIAVVTPSQGAFKVSIRVPRSHALAAAAVGGRYRTGGGRALAAGIDRLERRDLEPFIADFESAYAACAAP